MANNVFCTRIEALMAFTMCFQNDAIYPLDGVTC